MCCCCCAIRVDWSFVVSFFCSLFIVCLPKAFPLTSCCLSCSSSFVSSSLFPLIELSEQPDPRDVARVETDDFFLQRFLTHTRSNAEEAYLMLVRCSVALSKFPMGTLKEGLQWRMYLVNESFFSLSEGFLNLLEAFVQQTGQHKEQKTIGTSP